MTNAEQDGLVEASQENRGEVLILWELVQTAHVAAALFRDAFARYGLTPTQFGVLTHLAAGDDFTKAQLARAVLVSPQSMDPIIDSLLTAGYVSREGVPRRGRAAPIRITDTGLALLAEVRPAIADRNRPERIGLDPAIAGQFVDQLLAIRTAIQQPSKETAS